MSNELSIVDLNQLPSTQIGTNDAIYDDLAKGAEFLQRLQLYTKGKPIDKGLIRPGHYGIPESEEEITDLGDSIDVLVLARRPKALDMSDKEAIFVSYDNESAEFKRIAATSLEKESNCMYGPSFLVLERSSGKFLEFFCGSKSTRAEAKKIYPFLPLTAADIAARQLTGQTPHGPLPMTLRSRLVEKGSWSWHVPVVAKCSVPFTNAPPSQRIVDEIVKFIAPKADGVERVENEAPKADSGKKTRKR
jgi:hypothetical protein